MIEKLPHGYAIICDVCKESRFEVQSDTPTLVDQNILNLIKIKQWEIFYVIDHHEFECKECIAKKTLPAEKLEKFREAEEAINMIKRIDGKMDSIINYFIDLSKYDYVELGLKKPVFDLWVKSKYISDIIHGDNSTKKEVLIEKEQSKGGEIEMVRNKNLWQAWNDYNEAGCKGYFEDFLFAAAETSEKGTGAKEKRDWLGLPKEKRFSFLKEREETENAEEPKINPENEPHEEEVIE